ncbi:MAG: SAM-dependent DNA methyltransferase [Clostridiales bacterium]|nr:SAM-dependent DNA methyltransferase [Clostridiales bacterium]
MKRNQMITTVGAGNLVANIENDEFSYPKEFKKLAITFTPITSKKDNRKYEKLDLRFVKDGVAVLIETKIDFNNDLDSAKEQLAAYVQYEKQLFPTNKIVAILANTTNDDILVWRGVVSDMDFMPTETKLKTIDEYIDFYTTKINNKEKVMSNTYKLNELLHRYGISEDLRSQFVGTCLLGLKNGLDYNIPSLTAKQIRARFSEILENLLNGDLRKAEKLVLLNKNVIDSQDVRALKIEDFRKILEFIEENILPFINDKSTAGQDLLNLFFITFNKYVGKQDKNQAFTPDHITDFMSKICGVNKHSVILDPCCGSGSFLVRAMTQALDDCSTAEEQAEVKKKQIYGIEYDENVYGLATTNMLIHSDGNSNIRVGSCFDYEDLIKDTKPNVILMNPPYNAQRKHLPEAFTDTWPKDKKEDPTKGFYFVKYICDTLNKANVQATLACLLPVACAIGSSSDISAIKGKILEENTLDAVFTLPGEVFYPGASASACCMVFKIGKKHKDVSNPDTFFGYYKDDGFKKKKNIGRVEQVDSKGNSKWDAIEKQWIELYRNRRSVDGLSAVKKVTGKDEWLCEAYMKTDYSKLSDADFQKTINDYLAFLVKEGHVYES